VISDVLNCQLLFFFSHSSTFHIHLHNAPPAAVAFTIILVAFFATIAFSCKLLDHKLLMEKRRSQTHLSIVQIFFKVLSISRAFNHAKGWYTGRSILLLLSETFGFLFIFLPFTVGILHRLLEPIYILSVPLSSLAICTIAGLSPVSLIGLLLSIVLMFIGMNTLYLTLLLSYRLYSWLIHRHFTLLLVTSCLSVFVGILKESYVSENGWIR
jgi:hypothetical protein